MRGALCLAKLTVEQDGARRARRVRQLLGHEGPAALEVGLGLGLWLGVGLGLGLGPGFRLGFGFGFGLG